MEWFNKLKRKINNIMPQQSVSLNDENLLEWLGISKTPKKILSEITYFTCLKILSETLGKLPLKFYQETQNGIIKAKPNEVYTILKTRPNKLMTPSIFWTTIENNRNHYGNAYVWIRREFNRQKYGGELNVKDFWIMPSDNVQITIDDKGIFGNKGNLYYIYSDRYSGEQYVFKEEDVLHFKTSTTFDGILGKPAREILKDTFEGGFASQRFINKLYNNGLTASLVLQYTGGLDRNFEITLMNHFKEYAQGAENAGGIIPVPIGMQLIPLNIKLTDAQFFELKKYSSLQIAGAFGIKPNQINDYEKSSYSNSEIQNLSFYVDTELFIIKQYEEELNYKLLSKNEIEKGFYFKFNEKAILRTDSSSQADILSKFINNGIYTPNEARNFIDLPQAEGGDILMVNGNYIPITQVGNQYEKGVNNNTKSKINFK